MTRFEHKPRPEIIFAIVATTAAVAVADWLIPLGFIAWILYVVPIGLGLRQTHPKVPFFVAGFATMAILVEMMRSIDGTLSRQTIQANRGVGIALLWGFSILVRQIIRTRLSLQKEQWLRAGQHGLSDQVQGDRRMESLGDSVVQFVAAYTNARVGAFYVLEGDRLRRVAGCGLPPSLPDQSFALNEGLVGSAAAQRKPVHVRDVPRGYFLQVNSGLGQAPPRELLVVPFMVDGVVNGVIELGFLGTVHNSDIDLMDLLSERIGIAVRAARDRSTLEELLEETQRQAEELQVQQEELRVANEELEEHGRALRDSQARLEVQQAELEQANSHLEEQSVLLTEQKASLERTQRALVERGEGLERASRYKSEFLANMSHELRTPLNSSLILARLLADNKTGNLTAEQVRYAESIYAAGNDLLDLINDILDLSRIESGHLKVSPEPVALVRLTDALAQTFRPLAMQKGLAFQVSIAPGTTPAIETDPQRLQQILKNLLANAVKFTDRGEVALRVSSDAGAVQFAVVDTGIGMPASEHDLVFEAFRQADGTDNRKHGGTGLGLSISRNLAHLLGGSIELISEPGKGSTFTLTLPVAYTPVDRRELSAAPVPPAPPPRPARRVAPKTQAVEDDRDGIVDGSRVLLVVEDDPAFARILYDLAHEMGFSCLLSSTADEGVELARTYLPAAVLLDMNLPDHPGLTVLDRLKRHPATRHIPVQVVSVDDHSQTALAMGAAGYMLKPVSRDQLVATLTALESRFARQPRSVLVVEDDPVQSDSICRLLTTQEVRTVPVARAADALEALQAATHDCMVLDLTLPDASGFELLERLAQGDQYAFPPVIIYTGRTLSDEEEQRLRRYARSIIIKGARSPERLLDEVTLFLHQVEASLPEDRRRMLEEARRRDAAFEGRRVLVVEDDVRNIFALSSILEPLGAQLVIARNGREALTALEQSPVDLVLMDIMMPEMDGYEAMQEIRRRPGLSKLPIIALTAKAMRDDKERCLAAGASDYIAKPIDVEQLLSLMRVWMPRQPRG